MVISSMLSVFYNAKEANFRVAYTLAMKNIVTERSCVICTSRQVNQKAR